MPPRTRAITSGLRNSECTPSIIPEAHSPPAPAQGRLPAAIPACRRNLRPHCLGQTGHSRAHPWVLGGRGHIRLCWEQSRAQTAAATGARRERRDHCWLRELSWQTAGRATVAVPGLALPWAQGKGRARGSIHRHAALPSRTAGSNKQVCKTSLDQDWDHQASCLAGEFSESGHCWIFTKLGNRSTRNHLLISACFWQGTPESAGSLKPLGWCISSCIPTTSLDQRVAVL